jgi:hypothetical protein
MFNQIWRNVSTTLLNQKIAKIVLLAVYIILAIVSSRSTDITSQMVGLLAIACIGFTFIFNLSEDQDVKYIIAMIVSLFAPLGLFLRGCFVGMYYNLAANNFHYKAFCIILLMHFIWLYSIVFFYGNRQEMISKLNSLFKKS